MKKIKQIVTIFAALALAVTAGLSFAGTKTKQKQDTFLD